MIRTPRWLTSLAAVAVVSSTLSPRLAAQHPTVRLSLGEGLTQYREQDRVLDFRGDGPVGQLEARWRDLGVVASAARYRLDPTDADAPYILGFRATETRVALRYFPLHTFPVGVEVGVLRRTSTPSDNAQAFRAYSAGAVAQLALADGMEVESRAAWLVGTKFSRGGTAKTAVALGLRASYRPLPRYGWGWVVIDYSYQRLERKTDSPVPLQGSTVTFGVEARFIP